MMMMMMNLIINILRMLMNYFQLQVYHIKILTTLESNTKNLI